MLRVVLLLLLVAFFVLGVTVGFVNAQPVRFNYVFGEIELPLIGLMIGELVAVVLVTLLVVLGRILSLRAEIRRHKRQLQNLEAELANLRRVPLEPAETPAVPRAV